MPDITNLQLSDMRIDASSLTPKIMSGVDCKQALADELQPILDKQFNDCYPKRQIKIKRDGLNFACPFCLDSATSYYKKRAHFILSGNFAGNFKCFNCGKHLTIPEFFSAFDQSISLSTLTSVKHMIDSSTSNYSSVQRNTQLTSEVINKDIAKQYAIQREYLKSVLLLQEITPDLTPDAYNYLLNRCQTNMEKFLYSATYKQIFILNLIDYNNILGIQMRDISGNSAVKYKTLTCSKIHKFLIRDNIEIPEYVDNLSTAFNIFNINLYKPILVTEGPFDSFLLPNCIATSGANKNIGIELPFWYVYDSDETGNAHAMQMLKQGYNVFMWKKFKYDYNLPNKNKWDISDVYVWFKTHNMDISKVRWQPYFTSSMLDGLNI